MWRYCLLLFALTGVNATILDYNNGVVETCRNDQCTELNLQYGGYTSIAPGTFENLASVRYLYLYDNKLTL